MKKLSPLSLAVISALSATPLVSIAQQDDHAQMEEVVALASPIRDSQKAAINAKRDANNFVDVIAADTIGRFPDQNLADSLGRIPGLAIERDQGQARYINFRGAPFRYTAIAIDGVVIPGAENGRIPRFDSFPSVITSRIEANKAITADMPGESIAGYINLNTFNPFDVNGWSVATDVGLGQQTLGDGDISKFSLRTSWSNEVIGFSVFGSSNSREQITDNREYDLALVDDELQVNSLDFRSYKIKREDESIGGRLEYRFEGGLDRVYISTLKTKFTDHEQRNQFVFDFETGASYSGVAQTTGDTGYAPLVTVNRLLEDGIYENSTWTTTLGLDKQVSDWFVEAKLNYTKTENVTDLPIPYSLGGTVAASYDVSQINDPLLTLYSVGTTDALDINDVDYAATYAYIVQQSLDIESTTLKLDAERVLTVFGQSATIKAGVSYNQRDADGDAGTTYFGAFPSDSVDIGDYLTSTPWDSEFTNSIGGTYYDNVGLRNAWEQASGSLTATPDEDTQISIDETITAAYGMLVNEYSWGNLSAGLRIEQTDYTSDGNDSAYSDDNVHWLPSANININLTDDVKLRMSLTTAISRPTYSEWRGSATIDYTSSPVSVSGGNPALESEEAWGGDIAIEWYAGDASLFTAGVFNRQIDKVIYADTSTIDGGDFSDSAAGESWLYTGYVNGEDGHLSGIEVNAIIQAADFLPDALEGFGVSANATFLDSEFTTLSGSQFSLPGTSDVIFNASAFYENDSFSARLNYQYRDAWLSTTENDSMGEYWDAQQRVDLSLSYILPWNIGGDLSLYANANNLTDEIDVRYIDTPRTPNQVESYGRRYLVGVRFNY